MTDEEKKAVESITAWVKFEESVGENLKTFRTVLNLIEKQSKMIDLMAEQLTSPINGKEWVIKYYEKEVGE